MTSMPLHFRNSKSRNVRCMLSINDAVSLALYYATGPISPVGTCMHQPTFWPCIQFSSIAHTSQRSLPICLQLKRPIPTFKSHKGSQLQFRQIVSCCLCEGCAAVKMVMVSVSSLPRACLAVVAVGSPCNCIFLTWFLKLSFLSSAVCTWHLKRPSLSRLGPSTEASIPAFFSPFWISRSMCILAALLALEIVLCTLTAAILPF